MSLRSEWWGSDLGVCDGVGVESRSAMMEASRRLRGGMASEDPAEKDRKRREEKRLREKKEEDLRLLKQRELNQLKAQTDQNKVFGALADKPKAAKPVLTGKDIKSATKIQRRIDRRENRKMRRQMLQERKNIGADEATMGIEKEAERLRQKEREREAEMSQFEEKLVERGEHLVNASSREKYMKLQAEKAYRDRVREQLKKNLEEDAVDAIRGATLKDRTTYNDSTRHQALMPEITHADVYMSSKEYKRTIKREQRVRELSKEERMGIHARNTWWTWSQKHRERKRHRQVRDMATASAAGYDPREEAAKQFHFIHKERVPRRTVRYWERWFSNWDGLSAKQRRHLMRVPGNTWMYGEKKLREIANHHWDRVGDARPNVMKRMRLRMKLIKNHVEILWQEWSEPQLAHFLYKRHVGGLFDLGTIQRMLLKTKLQHLQPDEIQKVLKYFATTKDGTTLLSVGVEKYIEQSNQLTDKKQYDSIINFDPAKNSTTVTAQNAGADDDEEEDDDEDSRSQQESIGGSGGTKGNNNEEDPWEEDNAS